MIGDVIFFKKTNTLISRVIANISNSEYTHVGLVIEYDAMTRVATIVESNRFIKTKLSRVQLTENHAVYTTGNKSQEMVDNIVKFSKSKIGTKYDYLQIFGLFLSLTFKGERRALFNSTNKFICSELIDLAYYKAGVRRLHNINIGHVTPQELIEVYDLKEIGKGV